MTTTDVRGRIIDGAALLALAGGAVFAVMAPTDRFQGDLQRLMYVHVPSAWLAYLSFLTTAVASIAWLRTRRQRWDRLALASVEVGLVFTGLTLVTGSLWGKPVWGVWWTWDPRLVTTALLFVVYLGYLGLRRGLDDPGTRARNAAVYGVIAVIQLPIVHFSVVWWRTLHQPPTVLRPGDPTMDHTMLTALFVNLFAFTVVFVSLVRRRTRLAALEAQADRSIGTGALAGDAVAVPGLLRSSS